MISNLSGFFCNKKYFSCSFHFFFSLGFVLLQRGKKKRMCDGKGEWGTAGLQDLCAGGIFVNANAKTAGRQCSMRCKETIP